MTSGKVMKVRGCYSCQTIGPEECFFKCPQCLAVTYCCKSCQDFDWKSNSQYCHSIWCDKMKKFMELNQKLCGLPFSFIKETTDRYFDTDKYKLFLERQGVYSQGLWKVESYNTSPQQALHAFGTLSEFDDSVVLPVESCILDENPSELCCVNDWESYYNLRGFRFDSPIAILLQWALTLYHILKNCLPTDYQLEMKEKEVISVDLVGVEKEADLCVLFKETGVLLKKKLDIHMFGPVICRSVDLLKRTYSNIDITLHHGLYHKKVGSRIPDIVIGFNAGLEAYTSWKETVCCIKERKIPAYFTDYCEQSVELTKLALAESCNIQISEASINPFRSPVRKHCEEHDIPWFSNGFIFSLKYK